jgi:glycine oxidase
VYELLRDCSELVPGIDELQIEELSVGLRPGTPDNAPAIGRGALEGLVWATGHHRNGILLAPLTAELVTATLTDTWAGVPDRSPAMLDSLLAACAPARFSGAPPGGAEGVAATAPAVGMSA